MNLFDTNYYKKTNVLMSDEEDGEVSTIVFKCKTNKLSSSARQTSHYEPW